MHKKMGIYLGLVVLGAVIVLSPQVLAQQGAPQQGAPQQEGAQQGPEQGAPPAPRAHSVAPTAKELSFLVGKWETQIQIYPNDLMPEGTTGKGTLEYTLYGHAIEGIRVSDTTRGHHEARELIGYDERTNNYQILSVTMDGAVSQRTLSRYVDIWVVEYTGNRNGEDFQVRGKYTIISKDELHLSSEVNFGKSGFKPYSDVTLKRISTTR
jgi:hypothetical protein